MDNEVDLDSVGEKLYELVYSKHRDMAPKLTGMLLELPGSVVEQMMQDDSLLKEALQRALNALGVPPLPEHSDAASLTDDADPTCDDALGEQLYEQVELYDTGHTQKITGMLLEQDRQVVLQLLSDPRLLQDNVGVALRSLNQRSQEEKEMDAVGGGGVEQDEVEEVGERLFTLVQDMESVHCADITGMLLEMDCRTLKQVLSDHTLLKVAVQRAKSALEGTSHQNSTPSHRPSSQ